MTEGLKPKEREARIELIASHIAEILGIMDEDQREGLEGTPERVARMYMDELFNPHDPLEKELSAMFVEETNTRGLIALDHIPFCSFCEHHMIPYFGHAHVGYIPHGGFVGLSKVARLVTAAGRGFSIQERLTDRIADALESVLKPVGVIVVIQAVHTCMVVRGVKAVGCTTNTSALRGLFRDSEAARAEFFSVVYRNGGTR